MRPNGIKTGLIDSLPSRFDIVIEGLLISLLIFMPLAFGAVEAWSQEVVIAFAAIISICFFLKLIVEKNSTIVWSWAYIPVFIFVLIAVFQLISLPTGLIKALSPNTVSMKQDLLGDLPGSDSLLKSMTLTFYPYATKQNLRLVISIAAIFLVVVNVYRQPEKIKRLLWAITIIGGSIALLAIAQNILGNGKIYWIIPAFDNAKSGTFINHSHFGQFTNLSIGAALGLIMVKLHETFSGKKVSPLVVSEYLSSSDVKVIWFLLVIIVIGSTAVFLSLTRGGMVSMLIAAGFTTLILSSRRSLKGSSWIMVLMALMAFIFVLYVGFDAVYDRLATLQELNKAQSGRLQIIKDISVAWTKFPLFGTGLGTHEVVYPMFDRSTIPALAAHAENEYAQAAEETGGIGLMTLVIFGVIVWVSYIRNITTPRTPINSAAYGLGFGLLAIIIHSFSDFGQHLPANIMLSVIFCALLIVLAGQNRKRKKEDMAPNTISFSSTFRPPLFLIYLFAVVVCGVWIWALIDADNARTAEAHWKMVLAAEKNLSDKNWQASDQEYTELISNAADAAAYQPDNVYYQHWLNVYRWESISRITDPNTGNVILPKEAMEIVKRIVNEFNSTRQLCPTYGATYCVVGQLEKFILNDPNGIAHIKKGYQLAPCDSTACYIAGLLDAEEQNLDNAYKKFDKALQLNGSLFQNIINVFINQLNRPDLAVKMAGDNSGRLSLVANALADMDEHKDIVEPAQARVVELLKEKCCEPDAPASALASLANVYRKKNNIDLAIENYRRALALEYGQIQWRYTLARLLAQSNQIPEAIHEARICLRLSPQFKPAEKLIADLSVLPNAGIKEIQQP